MAQCASSVQPALACLMKSNTRTIGINSHGNIVTAIALNPIQGKFNQAIIMSSNFEKPLSQTSRTVTACSFQWSLNGLRVTGIAKFSHVRSG